MATHVVCPCCWQPIPVTPADVGAAVLCPVSRRVVIVRAEDICTTPDAPLPRSGRGRRVLAAAVVLLLCGVLGWVAWDRSRSNPVGPDVARAGDPTPGKPPPSESITVPTEKASPDARETSDPSVSGPTHPAPPKSDTSAAGRSPTSPIERSPNKTEPSDRTMPPSAPPAGDVPTTPSKADRIPPTDGRFPIHLLAKRIDTRTAEELRRELQAVREVSLDPPGGPTATADRLFALAATTVDVFPGPAVATRGRPDLAGLPFIVGADASLAVESRQALNDLSRELRTSIAACTPPGEVRPDPDRLYEVLLAGEAGLFRGTKWATPEAVPCIQQMLQVEGADVRRMSVELLRGMTSRAASEALVRWAVFDLEAANRAAAVDALRGRDSALVVAQLLRGLRYPWPRAAEHAAEALVALGHRSAVPSLIALLPLADPDAPFVPSLSSKTGPYRHEMVRTAHARNCVLCHRPSTQTIDLVRGAVPDPSRPLPTALTPQYYTGGSRFVAAGTTYLRQDFSVVQPVPPREPWPDELRFDYFVAVRPAASSNTTTSSDSPYRRAVLFALRELTGHDLGDTAESWAATHGRGLPPAITDHADAARYVTLAVNPDPYLRLKIEEFGVPLLAMPERQQLAVTVWLRKQYGAAATRYALFAYLEPLAHADDATVRTAAEQALAKLLGIADQTEPTTDAARSEAAKSAPSGTVEELVAMLRNANPMLRAAAAAGLAVYGKGSRSAVDALIVALRDADAEVRYEAAIALGVLGPLPEAGGQALAAATADAMARVRAAAAAALANLGYVPPSGVESLARAFTQVPAWDSPEQQATYYTDIGRIVGRLGRRGMDVYPAVLKAATGSARTQAPPAVISACLRALGPPPDDLLRELVLALGRKDYRADAEANLIAAGDDAARPLIDALKNGPEAVRAPAARTLGKVASLSRRPPPALPVWRAAIDALGGAKADKSADVRTAAAEGLANLSTEAP